MEKGDIEGELEVYDLEFDIGRYQMVIGIILLNGQLVNVKENNSIKRERQFMDMEDRYFLVGVQEDYVVDEDGSLDS